MICKFNTSSSSRIECCVTWLNVVLSHSRSEVCDKEHKYIYIYIYSEYIPIYQSIHRSCGSQQPNVSTIGHDLHHQRRLVLSFSFGMTDGRWHGGRNGDTWSHRGCRIGWDKKYIRCLGIDSIIDEWMVIVVQWCTTLIIVVVIVVDGWYDPTNNRHDNGQQ